MRTDWRLIGLLFLTGLFAAAQFAKISLTLVDLGRIYPGAALPFAVSALSVAGILFGVAAGMIVAQFGARRVLLVALASASVISLSQSVLPSFQIFMGLRIVEGFSHLAIVVAAVMSAVGAAGIPGTGYLMLSVVLSTVPLPLEGLTLLLGIDRLREMFSTALNIVGDAVCCVYVAKREGELDERQYYHAEQVQFEGSDI